MLFFFPNQGLTLIDFADLEDSTGDVVEPVTESLAGNGDYTPYPNKMVSNLHALLCSN